MGIRSGETVLVTDRDGKNYVVLFARADALQDAAAASSVREVSIV